MAFGTRVAAFLVFVKKQQSMFVLDQLPMHLAEIGFLPMEVGSADPSQMNSPLTSQDSPLGSHTELTGSAPILAVPI